MKKRTILLICTLLLTMFIFACGVGGGSVVDERDLNHFVQAFNNAGYVMTDFDENMRMVEVTNIADMTIPLYYMIDAENGVLFYIDNSPVVIYEFADTNALGQAFEDFPFMEQQGWVSNGRFVIEAHNLPEIKAFFGNIQ